MYRNNKSLQLTIYYLALGCAVHFLYSWSLDSIENMKHQSSYDYLITWTGNHSRDYYIKMKGAENMTSLRFMELRGHEYKRRSQIFALYAKSHQLNYGLLRHTVAKTLAPFHEGIVVDQIYDACSMQEHEAICFFIQRGKVMTKKIKDEKLKATAKQVAKLIYRAQASFRDEFPNLTFVYNTMKTPRVIPGHIPNNTLNMTTDQHAYYPMIKKLCPKFVEQHSFHGDHLRLPGQLFVVHNLIPIFSASVLEGCTADIMFPHHEYADWPEVFDKINAKYEANPWEDRNDTRLFWHGTLDLDIRTTGYIDNFSKYNLSFANITNSAIQRIKWNNMLRRFDYQPGNMVREAWGHKYIVDLDDHTRSEVFHKIIGSGAVIFKHPPLYREFFYDWIIPNLHLVPIDEMFKELNATYHELLHDEASSLRISQEAHNAFTHQLKPEAVYGYIYHLFTEYWFRHNMESTPKDCMDCIVY